jgi:hypothetical protein
MSLDFSQFHILADIEMLQSSEKAGRRTPFTSGYHPQFSYLDNKTSSSSVQIHLLDRDMMCPGEQAQVGMNFLVPELHVNRVYPSHPFELCEGSRVIGRGTVIRVFDLIEFARKQRKELPLSGKATTQQAYHVLIDYAFHNGGIYRSQDRFYFYLLLDGEQVLILMYLKSLTETAKGQEGVAEVTFEPPKQFVAGGLTRFTTDPNLAVRMKRRQKVTIWANGSEIGTRIVREVKS